MLDGLYNTDILSLAANIANVGQLENPHASVRKVSKLCGSWLEIDVCVEDGLVTEFAIRLEACALGQASASILSSKLHGASLVEVQTARDGLYGLLKGEEGAVDILKSSRFIGLLALSEVAKYPARHISSLLAFDAALSAIKTAIDGAGA